MSEIEQLTRIAFLSGLSPGKWRRLITQSLSNANPRPPDDMAAVMICDTILLLLGSFHGDSTLKEYLRSSVTDITFPVNLWHLLPTFLRNVQAANLHDASTIDMICRLVLDLHYESHGSPLGSLIPFSEHPSHTLNTISNSIYLLRLSYEFPASPFHHLTNSASELLIIMLTCTGDMSEVSATQATLILSSVHEVLQLVALQDNVRQALNAFLLSFSLLLGDGTKQVEEAEMFASFQLTPGPSRQEAVGPHPSHDLLTGTLIMDRLVSQRATQSGSGCESVAVANLMAWYRVSMPTLGVFYAHAILSALACFSQVSPESHPELFFIWKSFVLARLPPLLCRFQERLVLEAGSEAIPGQIDTAAMQTGIAQVFTQHELLDLCEIKRGGSNVSGQVGSNSNDMLDDDSKGVSFRFQLLASLISSGLLDHTFANELLPTMPQDFPTKLALEAQEYGTDVDAFIEAKISVDATFDDIIILLDRIVADHPSHASLAEALLRRFVRTCETVDVENLGRLCKILSEHDYTIDILSIHIPVHEMIAHALAFLGDYDLATVGDPQTAVIHIGEIVLFLQSVFFRYHISSPSFKVGDRVFRTDALRSASAVYLLDTLSDDDKACLDAWRKALFDHSREGIDDDILRSTKPRTLLRLSATLMSEAIAACNMKRIDGDALSNGVSYYVGPLLNWTFVGVVQALLDEVERGGFQTPTHMAILESILTDPKCPSVVLRITRQQIVRLQADPKAQARTAVPNMSSLLAHVLKALSLPPPRQTLPRAWMQQPRTMILQVFAAADTGKVPSFDIERCLTTLGVTPFLDLLWTELARAALVGKTEVCRRFATFVFAPTSGPTTESATRVPPLLPIFLHAYVPTLLTRLDRLADPEQTRQVQLLATVVVSALTFAVNFERALLKPVEGVVSRDIKVHNLPCAAMARRLRLDLRRSGGASALALLQKLLASSTFVSTSPTL